MRIFLLAWLVCAVQAGAQVFQDGVPYRGQYLVAAAAYPSRRILRSSPNIEYTRPIRSRVFRNVQLVNVADSTTDEPKLLRSSGRFHKRIQAAPIHDIASQQLPKDSVQIAAFSYDEQKHHANKLSVDQQMIDEAAEFARGMERTTLATRIDETTTRRTTPVPKTTTQAPPTPSSTIADEVKPEFKQPPPAFAQPSSQRRPTGARTFSQTVQATGQPNVNLNTVTPVPRNNQPTVPQPNFRPQPPQQQGQQQGLQPQIRNQQQLIGGIPQPQINHGPDPFGAQLGVPQVGPLPGQIPPLPGMNNLVPNQLQAGLPPPIPNQIGQPPQIPQLPNGLQPPIPNQIGQVPQPHVPHIPPPLPVPVPQPIQERFEVINGQAANSSLEQLGCNFDWITNTCKDLFNLNWCGRCHDFGNIFVHDCKCIQPLITLPPRSPRPALFRLY